ncbi:MAG: GatB/YqeY domain-containing protein [Smithella sp.]
MLINQIKKYQVEARKNKDSVKANLLTTLIGEAEMVGKNNGNRAPSDAEVQVVIKKFIKGIDEILTLTFDKDIQNFLTELAILKSYLPEQLSQEQLASEISKIISSLNVANPSQAIGAVMKELSAKFSGKFDSKQASILIKENLVPQS